MRTCGRPASPWGPLGQLPAAALESEGKSGKDTVKGGVEKPGSRGVEAVSKKRTTRDGGCSMLEEHSVHTIQLLPLLAMPQLRMD